MRMLDYLLVGLVLAGLPAASGAADNVKPLRILPTEDPIFPQNPEAADYPWGQGTAVILVDEHGQLLDVLVQRATNESFAEATERALRLWRYEPARRNGEPISARQVVTLNFEARGVAVSMTRGSFLTRRLDMVTGVRSRDRFASPRQLDAPLQVLEAVPPRAPAPAAEGASVVLDFFVDETGRPRMPVVLSAASDQHALAAMEALEHWRFAPPKRGGRPVIVHAKQEFQFDYGPS
jgi:TonB family protein